MKMKTIALFKNKENDYYVLYDYIGGEYLSREMEAMKLMNYEMVSCVVTNNKEKALKTRLQYCLTELRNLDSNVDYLGYEESLMRRIGRITSRLLRREVEVTDELALQCYDLLCKERLEKHKMELQKYQDAVNRVCMECAYSSEVCENCPVRLTIKAKSIQC